MTGLELVAGYLLEPSDRTLGASGVQVGHFNTQTNTFH